MKWTPSFSRYLAQLILIEWEKANLVEYKAGEDEIIAYIHQLLSEDLNKEKKLEEEVNQMLDELEKTHGGQFERYKMYPILKRKMAEKKGIIL